jgi:two-component system sensor histidine kinase CpxA
VVRNAIRYTPVGTPVEINLRRADGHAFIKVRDQGPGVPEQALPHLFEPFYRVNDARDRDSGGVGLGLAITRQVVTAHGGSVRAANCAPVGLEVTIELPLKVPELTQRAIRFRT